MKKLVIIFTTLMLFTQPLYGLAPQEPDWGSMTVAAAGPVIAQLKNEKSPQRRSEIQEKAEGLLSKVENTQRVVPYWNTLVFNKDGSFEIVVDYVNMKGESKPVINRFEQQGADKYNVAVITKEPLVNDRIVCGTLGLILPTVAKSDLSLTVTDGSASRQNIPVDMGLVPLYGVIKEQPPYEALGIPREVQEKMSDTNVIGSFANSFKQDNPELNPALKTAMYAYESRNPILAVVSPNKGLTPLFEWTQRLVNESLGKEGKGPYLTFAIGKEASKELMSAPKGKLFLVVNVGEEKIDVPSGVSVIEINIAEINPEMLAKVFLFLEEFTIRYSAFLGINPVDQHRLDRFNEMLTENAGALGISPEEREKRQAQTNEVKKTFINGGVETPELLEKILIDITKTDQESTIPLQIPKEESGFQGVSDLGKNKLPEQTERQARNLAKQLYTAEKLGISVNPFFIYSANPEVKLLGEFIRYLGQKRMARLARFGGGILWDYLIGNSDLHSAAQLLGASGGISISTFIHFLQEPVQNPSIIGAGGATDNRLVGKTQKEADTLYLESVRQALNNEGRLTNTINVPNEREENLRELYQLLVRASELYSKLVEHENGSGISLGNLVSSNESVRIEPVSGVTAGGYGEEMPVEPIDLGRAVAFMQIGGVSEKGIINPQVKGTKSEASGTLDKFMDRVSALARMVSVYARKNDSFLNRLANTEELKEKAKPEFYVLKLEDTIAKVEIGSEVSDTLWEEIRIKAANTMIAKTVQEIKRINPKAMVVVYTEDKNMTERRIKTALDAVESAGVFDMIVCGNVGQVLAEISNRGWAKSVDEAMQRTIFASVDKIEREGENVRSVIVPNERFIPFPELITVMHAMLNIDETQGLPIDRIIESYRVWLELAGFSKDEIESYIGYLRNALSSSTNYVVTLPIPPVPKAGSVIELLDKEYDESADIKSFA